MPKTAIVPIYNDSDIPISPRIPPGLRIYPRSKVPAWPRTIISRILTRRQLIALASYTPQTRDNNNASNNSDIPRPWVRAANCDDVERYGFRTLISFRRSSGRSFGRSCFFRFQKTDVVNISWLGTLDIANMQSTWSSVWLWGNLLVSGIAAAQRYVLFLLFSV